VNVSDPSSARPAGTPRVPARIADGMRAAIADPRSRPNAYIRLTASGGVRGEAYEFEFTIHASGVRTGRIKDQLKNREHSRAAGADTRLEPQAFTRLAQQIDVASLLQSGRVSGGFPPDSVVGRLEISDGEQTVSFLFLADESQAERSRVKPSEPLRRAVDLVYRAAAEYLGEKDVRP